MFKKLIALFKSTPPAPRKHGDITNYYKSTVKSLKPGEMAFISASSIDVDVLRKSVSSYTIKNWGRGAANTRVIRSKNIVKVVRIS
jgi:hypothetical protein